MAETARHPSLQYTASTNNWFTNGAAAQTLTNALDAMGNVTQRVWRQGTNFVRSQTLSWDGHGRLWKVSERDAQTNGFDWSAVYDWLGR